MAFKIVKPREKIEANSISGFVFEQDYWNDFSFQTQYHLHYVSEGVDTYIGVVKILKKGQTRADGVQLNSDFEELTEDFISVGQSLDYYQHLSELGSALRDAALAALRDFIRYPSEASRFRDEDGWGTSLFRDFDEHSQFIVLARALLNSDYTSMPLTTLKFGFHVAGWSKSLQFDFEPQEDDFLSSGQA